ncbi:clusterin isoform X2 [Engraulis encrasicolus]|uniref:clusterin isoform X2 n=1 Tax=Engraulis encrasicolus TaxID=184585 RepID=UPI002FD095F8
MRVLGSALLLALLCASSHGILPPSKEDLGQISVQGEKYLDQQIENAITGVKEMKTLMEKSGEDHKKFLTALEKTKQQKEEALAAAQEMEARLEEEQEECNETLRALWEECKPCLRQTCVRYYSRSCSTGSGLIGRRLEDVLNRTSPFSIWINGENADSLARQDQQQTREFHELEGRYGDVSDGVESVFRDSMRVFERMSSLRHPPPFFGAPLFGRHRFYRSPSDDVPHHPAHGFHSFQSMFQPVMDMARGMFDSFGAHDGELGFNPTGDESMNEDVVITKPFGDDRMTCREIRRNSAGCIRFKDECEKCKAIEHIDCSGQKPLEGPLKQQLEQALERAERFTQDYNRLLRRFEEEMFNTSRLMDLFNKQFGWVSTLANNTQAKNGFFQIKTILSRDSEGEAQQPGETKVSVELFDAPPMSFSVPGDIPWSDPKFSEVVAQEALECYKQTTVVVK